MTAASAPRRPVRPARPLPQESAGPRLRLAPTPAAEPGWRPAVVTCVAAFFLTLVMIVAIQGERIRLQEQSDRIAAETAETLELQRELRVGVAEAGSPEQILEAARSLGMVEPGPIAAVPAGPAPAAPSR